MQNEELLQELPHLAAHWGLELCRCRPDLRIGDVAEHCGFLDVAYFSRVFRQHYGMTPTQARNGAE